jgi:hypothetical protein
MLSIQLHAQNKEQTIDRYYGLRVNKNLFGAWTITLQYAQLGKRGPSKLFFCDTLDDARTRVNIILKRRLNGKRKAGYVYKITHIDADPSICLDEWIPSLPA